MFFSVSWNSSSSFFASFFAIATFSSVLGENAWRAECFRNMAERKRHCCILKRAPNAGRFHWHLRPFHGEHLWPRKKLCPKNSKNDCRGGQIECRSDTKSRGQGRNGRCDRCRRSRRRSGHEVAKPSRKYRPRTKNGSEKAGAQDKAKSNTQDAAKEKTLGSDYLFGLCWVVSDLSESRL